MVKGSSTSPVPLAGFVVRDVADVQDGEPVGRVLAGRQAGGVDALLHEVGAVAVEETHAVNCALPGARLAVPRDRPVAAPC